MVTAPSNHAGFTPFLRWAGSKRQQLGALSAYWRPSFERYVEPFAGSASLFFKLCPAQSILSDLNKDLIATFRTVKESPDEVHRFLCRLPIGKQHYYAVRNESPDSLSPARRAARFIYLNRFCFNGLHRTNLKGKFNVPYGAPKNQNVPSLEQLHGCSLALTCAELEACDFRETLQRAQRGDFVYLDPPYALTSRRVFVEYGDRLFSSADLHDLKNQLARLDALGVFFVVTYAYSRESMGIFQRWRRKRVLVRRNVAGFSGFRRNHYEIHVTNIPQ